MVTPVTETGSRTDWGVSLFLEMSVQFSSVAQLCLTLCDPWTAAHQASLSITNSWSLFKLMYHLVLCHPLLLLPSSFPSIRVFSNESVFHTRWPVYWSFSFSISPSFLMLTKGNINFFYKSQSKSSEGYFIGHTYKPLVITFMLIFFFFANMTPPKAICSYFRFGV